MRRLLRTEAPHGNPASVTVERSVEQVLSRAWRLDPQVALRPEPFGALAYHFGSRRLSFLKSPKLAAVVNGLAGQPDAAAACRAAGVSDSELASYGRALAALADRGMICEAQQEG